MKADAQAQKPEMRMSKQAAKSNAADAQFSFHFG